MPQWLARFLESPIPTLLDLLNNVWWALGLLFALLLAIASRLGIWKRCDQRELKRWCSHLGLSDQAEQQEARKRLIACGAWSVSPLVDTLYRTDSDKQRETVVAALCEIGPLALRPLLVAREEDSIAPFVDEALGKELPKIVERRKREQEYTSVWKRLRDRIIRTNPKQIVGCLTDLLDDPDPVVQEGAALALGQYPWPEVVQRLGRKLYPTECGHPEVRKMVVESLRQMRHADAIPYLKIGLRDTSREVRISTCRALSEIGQQEAIGAIEEVLLPFEEPSVRIEAAKALGSIGGPKVQEILERALQLENIPDDDDHRELRTAVGRQLAELQCGLRGEE